MHMSYAPLYSLLVLGDTPRYNAAQVKADLFDAKMEMYARRFWTPQTSTSARADTLRRVSDLLLSSWDAKSAGSATSSSAASAAEADGGIGRMGMAAMSVRDERAYLELKATLGLRVQGTGENGEIGDREDGMEDDGSDADGEVGVGVGARIPGHTRQAGDARCKKRSDSAPGEAVEIRRLLPTLLHVRLRLPYPGDTLRLLR